jgi:hypothetical protein
VCLGKACGERFGRPVELLRYFSWGYGFSLISSTRPQVLHSHYLPT